MRLPPRRFRSSPRRIDLIQSMASVFGRVGPAPRIFVPAMLLGLDTRAPWVLQLSSADGLEAPTAEKVPVIAEQYQGDRSKLGSSPARGVMVLPICDLAERNRIFEEYGAIASSSYTLVGGPTAHFDGKKALDSKAGILDGEPENVLADKSDNEAEEVEDEEDESIADRPIDLGPTISTDSSLEVMSRLCDIPSGLEFRIPNFEQRPWSPPEGFLCLYESFFIECNLWFPLPDFLMRFCARRGIAISQLTVAAIRNTLGLVILGKGCGIKIDTDFFEEATCFTRVSKKSGYFYTNARPKHKIVVGESSKTRNWERRFFIVRVSAESVQTLDLEYFQQWNFTPDRPLKLRSFPPLFHAYLGVLREQGDVNWPHILRLRIQRSRKFLESSLPSRPKMGKTSRQLSSYNQISQEKKSASDGQFRKPSSDGARRSTQTLM